MLELDDNQKLIFPKIDTVFKRNSRFKVIPKEYTKDDYAGDAKWEVTEKIDGTNIRIIWHNKKIYFEGRTEKSEIPKRLLTYLTENFTCDKLSNIFDSKSIVLYGEGYGKNIQSGDGYSENQEFTIFQKNEISSEDFSTQSVLVGKKLQDWNDLNNKPFQIVPYLGEMTIDEIVEKVSGGFKSELGTHPKAEGVVAHRYEKGQILTIKLKQKDF